mgnify:CR=1 FL=1
MTPRALVTGAGARLGRAMALSLAQRGHDVAVHFAGSRDGAEATVAEIRAMGRKAEALQADLLVEDEAEALVPRAVAALGGPLTLLVNNASIFEYDNLETATRESWDRHIGSNLRAPFVLTQHFAAQVPEPVQDAAGEPLASGLIINMIDQRVLKLTPERGSNPADITAALGYFLDAPAVTGQLLCVDAGQHLAWQTRDVLGLE